MPELESRESAPCLSWQRKALSELTDTLASKRWCRAMFLRGSLARGLEDFYSDIDLVVAVSDCDFSDAVDELMTMRPLSGRTGLPPWVDSLVRDFGGIGLVYLLPVEEERWGQIDIYLLPQSRRPQLLEHDSVVVVRPCDDGPAAEVSAPEKLKSTRQRYDHFAVSELEQGVLACYVAAILLRKRLIRGDPFQAFSDTYALANCVKDLIVLACHPGRHEQGWRGLSSVAQRSADPDLIMKVLSTFGHAEILKRPADLSSRIAALEAIVRLVVPNTWMAHGPSLQSLGSYLVTNPAFPENPEALPPSRANRSSNA